MPEVKPKVELIRSTYNPQELVALAAKLCYSHADLDDLHEKIAAKDQSKFIRKLVEMGHESPTEHVSFTFAISGVSRSFLAQITRHRIAQFSVQSQRYVGQYRVGDTFNYIVPPQIKDLGEIAVRRYEQQMAQMQEWYNDWIVMLGNKGEASNEDARFILPNAAETRMIVTMNARELKHFFGLRCCNRAQWEIRYVAWEMLRLCKEEAPELFSDAGPSCVRGKCSEGEKSCGRPYSK